VQWLSSEVGTQMHQIEGKHHQALWYWLRFLHRGMRSLFVPYTTFYDKGEHVCLS
jgi:hypothetical protein